MRSADELSFEQFSRTLRDYEVGKTDRVVLNGGEPTLHPELIDISAVAHEQGCETVLYTNGVKLSDKDYAKSLVGSGVDRITLPIHGEARLHDSITGVQGSFGRVVAGIRNLLEVSPQMVELKFIVSNAMATSNFSISDFIWNQLGSAADGCGVVIAGQVNTRIATANGFECVQDARYCNYVARQLQATSPRRKVKFCDFEVCRFSEHFRAWFDCLRVEGTCPIYEYRFCDSKTIPPRLMPYSSLRSASRCIACPRNKFCRSILDSYLVTKIEGETKELDLE